MTQFVAFKRLRSGDVIVTDTGTVCTISLIGEDLIDMVNGAGDLVGQFQRFKIRNENLMSGDDNDIVLFGDDRVLVLWRSLVNV